MTVVTIWAKEEQRQEGLAKPLVHVAGPGVAGMDTICGNVDRTDFRWEMGHRKVNCRTCLSIWNFIKGGELP